MPDSRKKSVLIVDDESTNIKALTHILSPEYTIYAAKDGQGALAAAKKFQPDIILLDIIMPEMDGYEAIAALKQMEETTAIPVIFITGLSSREDEQKGLAYEAADYISKPFSQEIVKLRVRNQIKIVSQMRTINRLSSTDQLTNIANRRGFSVYLDREWGRTIREQLPISILMLDVDNFKIYNDTYGHPQGDIALIKVANLLTRSLGRSTDFAARWGGEEFIALLPNTESEGAIEVAERIRALIEDAVVPLAGGGDTKMTVSVGANTEIPNPAVTTEDFIREADNALYAAKAAGRNRVCFRKGNMTPLYRVENVNWAAVPDRYRTDI